MKAQAESDGILHIVIPTQQHWGRALLPGIARYVNIETPFTILYHDRKALVSELKNVRPSALLGAIPADDHELLRLISRKGIPTVNISSRYRPAGIPSVLHDDLAIGRMAAEYLAEFTDRTYVYFGMGEDPLTTERFKGFLTRIRDFRGDVKVSCGKLEGCRRVPIARDLKLPAAAFCASDAVARALALAAEKAGIRIPEELAILGVDDDPLECFLHRVPISSIVLRFDELARRAAESVWSLYRGQRAHGFPVRIPPSHVEMRASTDFVFTNDSVVRHAIRVIRHSQEIPATVASVASRIGVSRRVLERRFRRSTGMTVFQEIHKSRMARALQLVEETDLPVDHISEIIGLADATRFAKLFKERYGLTPTALRKTMVRQ